MRLITQLFKAQPSDAIKSGALNLTLASGLVSVLVIIADGIPGIAAKVLGDNPSPTLRAAIFIAAVAVFAVIAAADIVSRGYASAHAHHNIIPLQGVHGDRRDVAANDRDWDAVALLTTETEPDGGGAAPGQYIVTKAGQKPAVIGVDDFITH